MSKPKEYIESILNQIAEITNVLVETAKIRDSLELAVAPTELKSLLDRTQVQVNDLFTKSTALKTLFESERDEIHKLLDENEPAEPAAEAIPADPIAEATPTDPMAEAIPTDPIPEAASIEAMEPTAETKPTIKLVDISKLIEPRSIIKKSPNRGRKSVQFNSDTIVIMSSDEDEKKAAPKPPRRRIYKAQKPTAGSNCLKIKLSRRIASESSSSGSDSSDSFSFSAPRPRKAQKSAEKADSSRKLDKNDAKLKSKCSVNLLSIPCEKLKEYYADKLEDLEIARLTNLNHIKRKRPCAKSDASKKDSKSACEPKNDLKIGESSSDTDATYVDETIIDPIKSPTPLSDGETEKDKCAELALNMICSDKEEESEEEQLAEQDTEVIISSDEEMGKSEAELKKGEKSSGKKRLLTSSEEEDSTEKLFNDMKNIKKNVDSNGELSQESSGKKKKRIFRKRQKKQAIISDSESEDKSDNEKSKDDEEDKDDQEYKEDNENVKSGLSSDSDKSESEKENEDGKKPPRKRVKRVADSSDDDDDANKSTRKQIRQVIGRSSLAETTKRAEAAERERKARILEKQKKYNQIYESDKLDLNAHVDKLILDFDEKNNKELLTVHPHLVKKLKPHQASGIQFMWDACFESIKRSDKVGSGCILAHCMGLGKTLQVIALAHTLLTNSDKTHVNSVLVVSPINTIINWRNEFEKWQPKNDQVTVYELVNAKQNWQRCEIIEDWHNEGGVLIIGYNMFRTLSNPDNKRITKKFRLIFQKGLVNPGPDLVVCDEGHLLKNEKTNTSIAMNRIKSLRRIVLTGTPLQNNLKEYFCMVQFIKPNLLGTYKEYLNRFVNPITNGQYTDSTDHDIQIMRKRSHVLHKMLDGVVQRRDYAVLQPYLPPKFEYVLFLSLTETQIKLYQHYLDYYAKNSSDGKTSFLFVDLQNLQRICTHPRVLKDRSMERREQEKEDDEDSEGSLKDFIDDGGMTSEESAASTSGSGEESDASVKSAKKPGRTTRATRNRCGENGEELVSLKDPDGPKEWWQEYCDGAELDNIAHSSKIFLLFEILKECEQMGDKLLVFSQSLYSLNVIEYFLDLVHNATQSGQTETVGGFSGSWCPGVDYFRLDGSSSCENRSAWCDSFNHVSNLRARLFLISTRAGGLGINLVAANRVIIFDVSWNPSHDIQSIYRVYRFGQTKPSYIYRFVTYGTMEMKIYERQVTKQAISKRVIDEQQIDRHYNQNDLQELYKFEPNPETRPIPLVPKDVLLGELLQKYEDRIYKYHEHQSLLENKEEEGLNEEERKAAWEEFENEKKARPAFNLGGITSMNATNIGLAILNLIKRENPNMSDLAAKQMVPIYTMQLQDQVQKGDLTFYRRVQQEVQMIMAIQQQHIKEYYQQMQSIKMFQEHQKNLTNNPNLTYAQSLQQLSRSMPGTSSNAPENNSSEVIELND